MQKSTNYGLNLPDFADQFNLNHWNENTEKLDLELKKETDSRINNDNQLQSNINNSISTLRSEISTAILENKNSIVQRRSVKVGEVFYSDSYFKVATTGYYARPIEFEVKTSNGSYNKFIFGQAITSKHFKFGNTANSSFRYITPESNSTEGALLIKSSQHDIALNIFNTSNYQMEECSLSEITVEEWNKGTDFPQSYSVEELKNNIENTYATKTTVDTLTSNLNTLNNQVVVLVCKTASSTNAKTISMTGFTLTTGTCIRVLFANGNNVANPTLNVNNTGAKEIVVPNGSSVKTLTSPYGSPNTGAYKWDNNTILELYYNGSYWVAINNPIIAQKTTCTDGTTADKPAYSCKLDGYKEIYGSCFIGDVGVSVIEVEKTFSLPMTMGSLAYNASIALRQNNLKFLGDLGSDVGLSYYGNTTSLTINMQKKEDNYNEIDDAVLTWIIKGY